MNFERLATDFAGIKLKTPVMGASGTFGFGIEYKDFLNLGDVGAIISKGLTPLPRPGNNGVRVAETPGGMLNCIGLENPGIEGFLRDILPKVRQEAADTAFIANFSAGTVEDYGMMAARLDVDGVDGVEVNISCPNVKEGGIVFGTDPRAAAAVTEAVKKNTKKPVIVKLSPNVTDIALMARAVEEAGADA
ncbi:tRNA-dihydrouridine synthase, partial [Anaerovibrio slackiae]